MKINKHLKWEISGIIVIFIIGSLWHNIYEILGENTLIGMIAPVNESKWEHWKLGLAPVLIYGAIQYPFIKDEIKNYLFSRMVGVIVLVIVCFGLIEIMHIILPDASFKVQMIIHLAAYFLGIAAGQIAAYYVSSRVNENKTLWYVGVILIFINLIVFILFTFNPPKYEYFKDSGTGQYGIE
ncbi:DUF6512 family protein [Oceanirhabdus sp. W0125-5]|uniref:DUF6512 family protein n=1 Tax=Oceanirhabdus sp. W0125-5 TaxID=2999116 RepID=UPI0022F335FD|nr:DUF6512 family protein [Oceanirhabdus sp. W0125-5]WBW99138.1 DUF6512 family protein [Oceanirhabdus sp. W0125-5]